MVRTIMSSFTQSVYAKKRKYSWVHPETGERHYIPKTFIGGITLNYNKYKH